MSVHRYTLSNLKPCPFCGNYTAVMCATPMEAKERLCNSPAMFVVYHATCEECQASGPPALMKESEAVIQWNRRAKVVIMGEDKELP